MPADRYPKRTRQGPQSERAICARSEKQGMKMADTHDIFLHQAPGRYLGMKSNGQLLLDRVHQDFPAGNTNLIRAPSRGRLHAFTMGLTNDLRITNVPVLDCFVNIILPEERSEIHVYQCLPLASNSAAHPLNVTIVPVTAWFTWAYGKSSTFSHVS
ncbi:hypothetical protein D9757_010670 [Collybiopsis confluens]|uniref:Uncharacterized protein n=1 Tax=Collybiopsis confluens TaxID=2823264 RepID=A0A8H5GMA5_9AGAR|nr:hypothetical protein D9757_010670 [Collybiopsis confluens]